MSDRDLRRILTDVIDDIDSGRVAIPKRSRLGRLGLAVGAPAALALGLAAGACDVTAAYGVPPVDSAIADSGTQDGDIDSGAIEDYGVPTVDAGPHPDAGLDAGPIVDYGVPEVDAGLDAGPVVDYGVPEVDGGAQ